MDPRTKDAIRLTAERLVTVNTRLDSLEEKMTEVLKLLRSIKNATVRGYKKEENDKS